MEMLYRPLEIASREIARVQRDAAVFPPDSGPMAVKADYFRTRGRFPHGTTVVTWGGLGWLVSNTRTPKARRERRLMAKRRSYDRKAAYVRKYGAQAAATILSLLGKNAVHHRWHRGDSC